MIAAQAAWFGEPSRALSVRGLYKSDRSEPSSLHHTICHRPEKAGPMDILT